MSQQGLSPTRWYLISACVGAWIAVLGAVAAGLTFDQIDLLGIIAGTMTVVVTMIVCRRRVERVFMHGYHAGYHDGSKADCVMRQPCDVLVLSHERAKRAL